MTGETVQNEEDVAQAFDFDRAWNGQAALMRRDGIVGMCRTIGFGCGLVAQWRMTEMAIAKRGLRQKNLPRRAVQAMREARQDAIENAAAIWLAAYSLQIDEELFADEQQTIDADERAALTRLLPALSVVIWNVVGDEWLNDPHGDTPQPVRQLIIGMASLGDSGHEIAEALAAQHPQEAPLADGDQPRCKT